MEQLEPLLKALTSLAQLWYIYLVVTWGWALAQFIRSLF